MTILGFGGPRDLGGIMCCHVVGLAGVLSRRARLTEERADGRRGKLQHEGVGRHRWHAAARLSCWLHAAFFGKDGGFEDERITRT